MSSISISVKSEDHPHVRSLNVLRDLPHVADLIELCFSSTMDGDGQRYLNDMRRASKDEGFLRWANHMAESTSVPMTGYVWEEDNRIVGNASLIPFRYKGKRIYLIANVATHPDYRGRGIGHVLTERVMEHARKKNASAVWLHVRDDNPVAIKLYQDLGFQELARRTTWQASPDSRLLMPATGIRIVPRHPRLWPLQQDWLRRLYPETVNWYAPLNLNALRPGLWNWIYFLLTDFSLQQWAAVRGDELQATLSWLPQGGRSESIFVAAGSGSASEALTQLLIHARRVLPNYSTLSLDYPAGEMEEAISAAGFQSRRTLIWMRV